LRLQRRGFSFWWSVDIGEKFFLCGLDFMDKGGPGLVVGKICADDEA